MTELKPAEINQDALRAARQELVAIVSEQRDFVDRNYNEVLLIQRAEFNRHIGRLNRICAVLASIPQEGAAVAPVAPVAWQWRGRASGDLPWTDWQDGRKPGSLYKGFEAEERPLYAAPAPSPAAGVVEAVLAEREKAAEFVRQWPKTWALDPKVGKRFRLDQVQRFINGSARAIADDILAGYQQSETSKPPQELAP